MSMLKRPRRLRHTEALRNLVQENRVNISDLVFPMFIVHGEGIKREIPALPGQYHYSVDQMLEELKEVVALGISSVLFFGIPQEKDEYGSEAYDMQGIVQRAVRAAKKQFPKLLVITDVCLCQYTSHGHCGIVKKEEVLNDETLDVLANIALSHAMAGADVVAPSDMMDGRVERIRVVLDRNKFNHVSILSYSVKYASAFYGPFRDAAGSAPQFGDRRSYQMSPANVREAIKEALLDVEEGADMLMVKPALAYLDVIRAVKEATNIPVAAYQVSGEYSMIKLAVREGLLDEEKAMLETLTSIKRAGADIILTYFAKDMAAWIRRNPQ